MPCLLRNLPALLLMFCFAASAAVADGDDPKQTWGFIDPAGTLVIPAGWDNAEPFSEGLALVKRNKQFFFIDASGAVVITIDPKDSAHAFHSGRARVYKSGTGYGYIDRRGAWVIRPAFSDATDFSDGVAVVDRNRLIDISGRPLPMPAEAYEILGFSEGLAAFRAKEGGKFGYLDLAGNIVIKPQFHDAKPFRFGRALVYRSKGDDNGYWIDRQGKRVVEPDCNGCRWDFRNPMGDNGWVTDTWGFYDANARLVLKRGDFTVPDATPLWYQADAFFEGRAGAQGTHTRQWGFINETGEFVVKPVWDEVGRYAEGLALVRTGLSEVMRAGREAIAARAAEARVEEKRATDAAREASIPASARLPDGRVRFVWYEAHAAMKAYADGVRSYYIRYAVVTAPSGTAERDVIAAIPMDEKPGVQPLTILASQGVYVDTTGVPGSDLPRRLGLWNPDQRLFKSMFMIDSKQFAEVSLP